MAEVVTSATLCREAIVHYTQLVNDDKWSGQQSARDRFVILTTKMEVMTTELTKLKASGGGTGKPTDAPNAEAYKPNKWAIAPWRLKKIDNGKEFGEILRPMNADDTRSYYFYEDGHYSDNTKVGMYCVHKPGAGHKEWCAGKLGRRDAEKGETRQTGQGHSNPRCKTCTRQ